MSVSRPWALSSQALRPPDQVVIACVAGGLAVVAVVGGLRTAAGGVTGHPDALDPAGQGVAINEVAWAGTEASPADEWIELVNTGSVSVTLEGWHLVDDDHLNIPLTGQIPPAGYYLIERTNDDPVSDIRADWTGSFGLGGLSNAGEALTLTDRLGRVVDTANTDGGSWPAGQAGDFSPRYASMERIDATGPDTGDNWCSNDGVTRNGLDAEGAPINGTPGARNACYRPPQVPAPNLTIAKDGAPSVRPGARITYRIVISNTGTASATDTVVTDTLPTAVTVLSQTSPFSTSIISNQMVWRLGDVLPGMWHRISVVGRVSASAAFPSTLVNVITATTTASETATYDNQDRCTATLEAAQVVHLPALVRNYAPPRYGVILEALLYDGLQVNEYDESVLLLNGGYGEVDLAGWKLCTYGAEDWSCAELPPLSIGQRERLWLARSGAYFARSFGFPPDHVLAGWPRFANTGDEVVLRDAAGEVRDALVYKRGLTDVEGWEGLALQPYDATHFAEPGQVLYRVLDEATGLPAQDTDRRADWAQDTGDLWYGRRVRYPGWDLERFFRPAVDASGTVTAAIAPDNAYELVVDAIRSARESIELEAYKLEHPGIVAELVERADHGVRVKVLLDGAPVGGLEAQELWACQQLHATGHGTCAFMANDEALGIYDRYTYLHAKFMVVDRQRLLLGSQNLSVSGLPGDDKANGTGGSRGVVVLTDAPAVVARAVEVFEADCDHEHHTDISIWSPDNALGYGPPPPGFTPDPDPDWTTYTVQFSKAVSAAGWELELVTAPEAALRRSDALLGLLSRASRGDAVYVEQLYERPHWGDPIDAPNLRLRAYLDAARRGACVRVLLNGGTFDLDHLSLAENAKAAAVLNEIAQAEELDLSAHLGDPTAYGIHNKMVLVDLGAEGRYVHVGSINGSETSNKVNREMALQVRSGALFDYLQDVFTHDWNAEPPEGHVLISEVMANPAGVDAGKEWVEIYNPTPANVDLSGWTIGDVGPGGEYGSGLYRFPAGATLVPEGVVVVAHQADDVAFTPDYEFVVDPHRDDAAVPNMRPAGSWDGFGLALGNAGDEVLLLDAGGQPVDVVTWGEGSYTGVVAHPGGFAEGHSLERRPPREDTDDCSRDFFDRYPATPGALPE